MHNTSNSHWTTWFFPSTDHISSVELKKWKMTISSCFLTAVAAFLYGIMSIFIDFPVGWWTMFPSTILYILLPFAFKHGLNHKIVVNLFVGSIFIDSVFLISLTGSLKTAPTATFLPLVPLLALLLLNFRTGFVWMLIILSEVLFFGIVDLFFYKFPNIVQAQYDPYFKLFGYLGINIIIYFIYNIFDTTAEKALRQLEEKNILLDKEKHRSDELLLNILPAEVMEELKSTGKTRARHYDSVSVIFADFKDFTLVSEKLSPEELVTTIDKYYELFDNLVEKFSAEKIKTVGDAYICAVGIPQATKDNAVQAVKLANEILRTVKSIKDQNNSILEVAFDIRIGIHTGPLIAGVVGIKKFAYDIWGDTVNTAARMQESGDTNRINISQSTYELVKDEFNCTYRGKVPAKNKGEIDMYFIS